MRLTPKGRLAMQDTYRQLIAEIEERWQTRVRQGSNTQLGETLWNPWLANPRQVLPLFSAG